ncbi:MAG TPA: zinc-ribbon domain-containing protein [Candidatus Binatia bacterium]|nr:zinc-ribbon domain-containing protein [Candidatus Binatia bacterium]
MPHCTKCGAEVAANAQFCQVCGQAQPAAAAPPPPPASPPVASTGSGLSENTAAALSYVLGWITGIIFFLIDKRPYVRFHAAQSIVTFGALHLIRIVLGMIFGVGFIFGGYGHWGYGTLGGFGLGIALLSLLGLLIFIVWIVCLVKAASGQRFMVPIAGPIAQNLAGQ